VSDLSVRERCIRDREWQESVVRLIYKLGVPIVPVHFLDRNSDFYYLLGLLDWRIRLLRLPSEVFNKRGKCTRIALGPVLMPQRLSGEVDIYGFRDYLREKVYTQY
jgi:putative hemolysin